MVRRRTDFLTDMRDDIGGERPCTQQWSAWVHSHRGTGLEWWCGVAWCGLRHKEIPSYANLATTDVE
ncbi:hypothetical protein LZ554_002994 [Drepanopeziza brunnea f. sp. 'monogermtubi']|nr:hypothetical protein LZ554_002994 [Drepanopeziza brunnea f. sp. 'monogermtubi']